MAITDRSQRFGIIRNPSSDKPPHLLYQTGLKHMFHALINAAITLFAWRIQAHRADGKTLQRPARFHFQVLRQRLPRLEADLQCSDDLGLVSCGNAAGRGRIKTL